MKRILKTVCCLLCVCLFLSLVPSGAAQDVVFLAVNDSFIQPMTEESMPVYINGELYVPYTVLSSFETINHYYNRSLDRLLVFDFWLRVTFDIESGVTTDEEGKQFSLPAVKMNGTVFIPLIVISQKFDFAISISRYSEYGSLVRINEDTMTVSDRDFTASNKDRMKSIFDDYQSTLAPPPEDDPPTPVEPDPVTVDPPDPPAEEPVSYLIVTGDPALFGKEMLSAFPEGSFSVFLTAEQIRENPSFIHRLICRGISFGILLDENSGWSAAAQIRDAETILKTRVFASAHLVCAPLGAAPLTDEDVKAISDGGYRLLDGCIDANDYSHDGLKIKLSEDDAPIILFEMTEEGPTVLLTVLSEGGYALMPVREWTAR